MRVVWQLTEENYTRQMGIKGSKRRNKKGPVAEIAPAAGGLGKTRGTRKAAPAARGRRRIVRMV